MWGWSGGRSPPRTPVTLARYVARRVLVLVPTLFFVSVLIFSLQKLLPGDAATAIAGCVCSQNRM